MADWISPDGFTDGGGLWTDETKIYDLDTGTYGYVLQNGNAWSQAIELDYSIDCTSVSKIRFWISMAADADFSSMQVRVYDGLGGEELVINSKPVTGQYIEANVISCTTVQYATARFCGQSVKYGEQRLHEFAVFGDGGPVGSPPSSFASGAYFARRITQLG